MNWRLESSLDFLYRSDRRLQPFTPPINPFTASYLMDFNGQRIKLLSNFARKIDDFQGLALL